MDELLEQFLIESRELVAVAAHEFVALASDPYDRDALDSAFRAFHTLKGSVALFALAPAEQLLHAAETVLEEARRNELAQLTTARITALVACLDQVDRWIDELEQSGALASDAPEIAAQMLAQLVPDSPTPAPVPRLQKIAADDEMAGHDWLGRLLIREAETLANCDEPLIAFRYMPDTDCFFRGDDPLAVAGAVPELLSLAVLPHDGQWPDAGAVEPFSCFTILEGVSGASVEKVAAAFQLVRDQVDIAKLDHFRRRNASQGAQHSTAGARMLRVDSARIDALGDALGDLLVAVNSIAPLAERANAVDRALAGQIRAVQADLERVTTGLRRSVVAVRSVPMEPALRRLPRLVREIAESLGKPVEFAIHGQAIEVDKQIADSLFEPLLHLVRNAIDHGIEDATRRMAAGKPPTGRIILSFSRDGDNLVAQLADDGAGIDTARVKRIAVERGLLTAEAADALGDAAARALIFAPGFSTAEAVTAVSGRGVGMDAVHAAITALRGTVDVESSPELGTTVCMRLPVSTLTTRLLVIEVAGDRYGVALDQIAATHGIDNDRLLPIGSGLACVRHGRTVPVLDLATLLGGEAGMTATAKLLIIEAGGEPVGLRVDRFAERIDALVRPRSGILAKVPGVTGSTLLGDGSILLVLDLAELAA